MILKKEKVIDKIVYVEVSEEEARKLYKDGINLIFDDEDEKEDFYERMEELDEKEEEEEEEEEDEEDEETEEKHRKDNSYFDTEKIKEFGRKAKELSIEIGRKVSDFTKNAINPDAFNIRNYNEKTEKLVKILPFMEDQDIHELVMEMLKGDGAFKDIEFRAIFPFLDEDDCDAIFMKALEEENYNFKLKDIAPFVSEECLTKVVDLYLDGKLDDKAGEIEKIYPFLSSEDIKRIFKHMIKNG